MCCTRGNGIVEHTCPCAFLQEVGPALRFAKLAIADDDDDDNDDDEFWSVPVPYNPSVVR
jgi:hypothetical protein